MSRRARQFPRMTCEDVLDALERHHAANPNGSIEWAFAREVPDSTGGHSNRIDALAMNCWRSKRYVVRAYEVKVSRADYRRELAQPGKSAHARAIAHEFVYAMPKGMVDLDELPDDGSGLLEVDHRGRVVTRRRPARTERAEWSASFLASVLRSAQRTAAVDKAKAYEAARRRVLAEVLEHQAALGNAPDPDAPHGEWRAWAERVTGDQSYGAWAAVDLLRCDRGGVDRDPNGWQLPMRLW